jgi:SAM-dependent methyltransferase
MTAARRHLSPEDFARTRALPPHVEDEIGRAFESLLPRRARVVDLGAGTGRLAHLLLARGFRLTALDLSRAMLAYLASHRPASAPQPWIVQGDVVALPLAAGRFDAAISSHVLHLVEHWEVALAEALRVLRPNGVFIRAWSDHEETDLSRKVSERWREILRLHGHRTRPGVSEDEPVTRWMHAQGMSDRLVCAATWSRERSPRETLEGIRQRHYPFSCDVDDDAFGALFSELETWAQGLGLDQEPARPSTTSFMLRVYAFPEVRHAS